MENDTRKKILIADDSDVNRLILSEMLGREFEVLEVDNGRDALEKVNDPSQNISLMLLDVVMPIMDGFDVLQAMNESNAIQTIPVVIISAENSSSFISKAYELGATDYITRPFNIVIIRKRVMNTLMVYSRQRELAEANNAKTAFLTNMSHEIRTPINAVLGLDEMILRECTDPAIQTYANDIKSAGKSLLSLVNDILDFSKIELGKIDLLPVSYEVSGLINDLVNMIAKYSSDRGIEFKVDIAGDIPNGLFGDDTRIKQCILNLLTNGVKYTKKGSVTLSITWQDFDEENILMHVKVKDTGIGIKKEDIPRLFHAFERIEEKRNRSIEGTGLGMNIVQQLLRLMDSKLLVDSVYGKGSEFSFTIKQKVVSREPLGDFSEAYQKAMKQTSSYKESFRAPNAKILVIDDNNMNLTVFKGLLKQTQVKIDTAPSGFTALALAAANRYDIIFIDHLMPGMDGIETFHALEKLDGSNKCVCPAIALTANAVSGARKMFLDEGFSDYLSKPVDGSKLEQMLLKYLPSNLIEKSFVGSIGGEKEKKEEVKESSPATSSFQNGIKMPKIAGIDTVVALNNCGSADIFQEVLKDFYDCIESKSAAIERFAAESDWKNFTVAVHALKSSARLVGATLLSEDALYLEQCGNKKDARQIRHRTPALLALYRSYLDRLALLYNEESAVEQIEENAETIAEGEFKEALSQMQECLEGQDFDNASYIVQLLEKYDLTENEKNLLEKIKEALSSKQADKVLALLS